MNDSKKLSEKKMWIIISSSIVFIGLVVFLILYFTRSSTAPTTPAPTTPAPTTPAPTTPAPTTPAPTTPAPTTTSAPCSDPWVINALLQNEIVIANTQVMLLAAQNATNSYQCNNTTFTQDFMSAMSELGAIF